jgi:regulator of cell morphogenesis and NO signaling
MSLHDTPALETGPLISIPPALESDADLIGRIVEVYHVPHLRDLLEAIELARRVEARHCEHPQAPAGLAKLLSEIFDHLAIHQAREETVLFPAMLNRGRNLIHPMMAMATEHDDVRANLAELRRLTGGFEPPAEACGSWRALYAVCGKFDADMREHIRLEEEVLFPRFA